MKLKSLTDIGIKRKENQDNYWSALLSVDGSEAGVVCICDGMGGLDDGGLASRIVVQDVRDFFKSSIDMNSLMSVLEKSNSIIYNLSSTQEKHMGTTCTVLLCYKNTYKILHVGDTRCYKLSSDGSIKVLTKDHSALAKYGITKKSDPQGYKKFKNLLTMCIGFKDSLTIDYYEGTYSQGDTFMLCSDGLWHYFDDYDISLSKLEDLKDIISKCIDNGETDNITVSMLTV